jgi:transposase-like protein
MGKRHKPEEIIGKLREAEIVLAQGGTIADASRRIAVSEQTYYRWRKEANGIDAVRYPVGYVRRDLDTQPFELAFCHTQRRDRYNRISRSMHQQHRRLREFRMRKPGVHMTDLAQCLPDYAVTAMREALPVFGRQIPGYDHPDVLMTGVETRTSSAIRFTRGKDLQSLNTAGLFPAGEGAGYAGGILSAAVDGIKIAEAVALSLSAA